MTDWSRLAMNTHNSEIVKQLPHAQFDALELSGDQWNSFPWRSFKSLHYPQFDICRDIDHDSQWDIIFAEQVFEHLKYPYRAARNVWRMLKPGGLFLMTTPFLLKIHGHPIDCTRWTPTGLKFFLEEAGFDPNATFVNSWGNRECVIANFERWVPFSQGMNLQDEPDFPIVVWALTQKSAA
jgi:SAM-dependent methyltransferase